MLTAVEFDDQLRFRAVEVGDVGADGMLAAESCASECAVPKPRPQLPLRVSLRSRQTTGVLTWPLADLRRAPAAPPPPGARGGGVGEPPPPRAGRSRRGGGGGGRGG